MKETEFRARFHVGISPDHEPNCYIIEKRTNGFNSKWKEVSRATKIGDTNAEKELEIYMKTNLNVVPAKNDSAYVRIKRL
jgi:hypothetical protein